MSSKKRIFLAKAPYFSPWTPPLGIAILKTLLNARGYEVTCRDYNADRELWGAHHVYFTALRRFEPQLVNDGYSKLWWVLNAHLLAVSNGGTPERCKRAIRTILPLFNIPYTSELIDELHDIVERFFGRFRSLLAQEDFSQYDWVGASTYTTSLAASIYLMRHAKHVNPNLKTVMGGGVFDDDLALGSDNLDTLLRDFPFIDHLVIGEGETLFPPLLDGSISQRVITRKEVEQQAYPIDIVPQPDFNDFDVEDYFQLTIEGGRSCPFQCSFCSETVQWGEYRKKTPEVLVSQMEALSARYGKREYFMSDSLMNPYIQKFSRELLDRGVNVLYDGYLRADPMAANQAKVQEWAASGLIRVRLGIESASQAILDKMDKRTTPAKIAEVLATLAGEGIRTTTYWIVGFPGETRENFDETLDFVRQTHRDIYELEAHPFMYYPYGQVGSRYYQSLSVYPEEVTSVIKFKLWEVEDITPNRHERFERLREFSSMASALGIPNIYSMQERYDADDRWRRLHPRARQLYGDILADDPYVPSNGIQTANQGIREFDIRFRTAESIDATLLGRAIEHLSGQLTRQQLALSITPTMTISEDPQETELVLRISGLGQTAASAKTVAEYVYRYYRQMSAEITPSPMPLHRDAKRWSESIAKKTLLQRPSAVSESPRQRVNLHWDFLLAANPAKNAELKEIQVFRCALAASLWAAKDSFAEKRAAATLHCDARILLPSLNAIPAPLPVTVVLPLTDQDWSSQQRLFTRLSTIFDDYMHTGAGFAPHADSVIAAAAIVIDACGFTLPLVIEGRGWRCGEISSTDAVATQPTDCDLMMSSVGATLTVTAPAITADGVHASFEAMSAVLALQQQSFTDVEALFSGAPETPLSGFLRSKGSPEIGHTPKAEEMPWEQTGTHWGTAVAALAAAVGLVAGIDDLVVAISGVPSPHCTATLPVRLQPLPNMTLRAYLDRSAERIGLVVKAAQVLPRIEAKCANTSLHISFSPDAAIPPVSIFEQSAHINVCFFSKETERVIRLHTVHAEVSQPSVLQNIAVVALAIANSAEGTADMPLESFAPADANAALIHTIEQEDFAL